MIRDEREVIRRRRERERRRESMREQRRERPSGEPRLRVLERPPLRVLERDEFAERPRLRVLERDVEREVAAERPQSSRRRSKSKVNAAAVAVCLVVAAALVAVLIFVFTRNNSQVIYLNDVPVGVVQIPSDGPFEGIHFRNLAVAKLAEDVGTRVVSEDTVTIRAARSSRSDFVAPEYIVRELRRSMSFLKETADIYVNGVLITTVINEQEAEAVLRRIRERFVDGDLAGGYVANIRAAFAERVEIRLLYTDGSRVVTEEQAYTALGRDDETTWIYRVQSGDMLYTIARNHGISLEELLRLNPDHAANPAGIRPGDLVTMVTKRPLLTVSG